jgi:transcriptional regulator with XRE-family HTH domain
MPSNWNSGSLEDIRRGATIRGLREAYGLTLIQLAAGIGVSAGYLGAIEGGKRTVTTRVCGAVAGFLKIPLAYIALDSYDQLPDALTPATALRAADGDPAENADAPVLAGALA